MDNLADHNDSSDSASEAMTAEACKDIYRAISVPSHLAAYVKRISLADCRRPVDFVSPAKPTGSTFLSWIFRGEMAGWVDSVPEFQCKQPWLAFGGQLQHEQIELRYRGCVGHLVVHFSALGAYQLLGLTGKEFAARMIDAASICERVRPLARDLARTTELAECIELMARHLGELTHTAFPVPAYLEQAVAIADAHDGAIRVDRLARQCGVSERQLSREFSRYVGLSPKFYCRTLQINHALEAMLASQAGGIGQIAVDANFADQSHFNRVFRSFLDASPKEFLESDEPVLRHFLGRRA